MSLMSLTAVALGKKVQAGEVTVEEAVLDALEQIEKKEDTIHSYVTVLEKEAILEKAKEIQKKIDAGELTGPLAGVPVAIKDNMCTEGVLTTCSSKILYNFVPTYTSEAVKNLEAAGAIVREQMDEFFKWLEGKNLIPRIQEIKENAVNDFNLRIMKPLKNTHMEEQEKEQLLSAVDRAMEKVVNKMLFGLRDSMNEQAFLECVAGLEKTYEK